MIRAWRRLMAIIRARRPGSLTRTGNTFWLEAADGQKLLRQTDPETDGQGQPAVEAMCGMQSAILLAQEMGALLGRGPVLLGSLQTGLSRGAPAQLNRRGVIPIWRACPYMLAPPK